MENHGILISPPRPKDYILGSSSKVKESRVVGDWSIYLPKEERQRNNVDDFLCCTTMSGPDHSIATQLNYLLKNNFLPDEAKNFFSEIGFIEDGLFSLSARFNAKLNGTDKTKGQYLNVAADSVRKVGILPEKEWPTTDNMTWEEFYRNIPIGLFEKARKALWFIKIEYHWVHERDLARALNIAPVQIASAICFGWDSGQPVQKCTGQPLQHATMIYGQDALYNWLDFDHYPPFKKILARDYELPLNLQYVVTVKPLALREGMHGYNVLQYQKDMNKLGFRLKEDGKFGPKTTIATKTLQNMNGLKADCVAGPLTLAKLNELTS